MKKSESIYKAFIAVCFNEMRIVIFCVKIKMHLKAKVLNYLHWHLFSASIASVMLNLGPRFNMLTGAF